MATTRRKAVTKTPSAVLSYAVSKADYVTTLHCSREFAADEFNIISSKGGKRCAYHTIQSFSPDDPINGQTANEIGTRLAEEIYPDFQCVIATHCDRGHIHNHIISNAVSLKGKRMQDELYNEYSVNRIREVSDRLCAEYGLSVLPEHRIGRYPHMHVSTLERRPYMKLRDEIRKDFTQCLHSAPDYRGFIASMEERGYVFRKKHEEVTKEDAFKTKRFYKLTQLVPFAIERLHAFFGGFRKKKADEKYIRKLVKKAKHPHDIALSLMINLRRLFCVVLHEKEEEKDIEVRAVMEREDIQNAGRINAGPLLSELEELRKKHEQDAKERERLSELSHAADDYMRYLPTAQEYANSGYSEKSLARNEKKIEAFANAEKILSDAGYLTERQIKRVRNAYHKACRVCSSEENRMNYLSETIEQMAAARSYSIPEKVIIRAHPVNGMVPVSDRWMKPEHPVKAGSWWFVPIEPDRTYAVTDIRGNHPIEISGKELVDYLPEKRIPEKAAEREKEDYYNS